MKKEKEKFNCERENTVLEGKGFYISYQPRGGDLSVGDGFGETALVKEMPGRKKFFGKYIPNRKFYILNGNWLEDYKRIILKGFGECFKFYKSKEKEFKNFWGDD